MLFEEPHRMQGWVRLVRKKWYGGRDGDCKISFAELDTLMGHAVAVTDAAASVFAAELIAAYPDAKVILNVRDLDAWHVRRSRTSVLKLKTNGLGGFCWFQSKLWWMFHTHQRIMWTRLFRCADSTLRSGIETNGKWIYREHSAMIRGLVPKEGLLEWDLTKDWEPLCAFLGKEVLKEPFPRINYAAGFQHRIHDYLDQEGLIALKIYFLL